MNFIVETSVFLLVRAGLRAQNSLESVVLDSQGKLVIISRDSKHVTLINLPLRSQCRNWLYFSRLRN